MSTKPTALLISGYSALSQANWADYLTQTCTAYQWQKIMLPPRYFSWRMRGAPLSIQALAPALTEQTYDLIVATSSVDLASVQSIYPALRNTPSILYFHENQFAYPAAAQPQSVVDWQMVSLYACLRADKILFNSAYNQQSFTAGLSKLLKKLPDLVPPNLVDQIEQKSSILPVPIHQPISVNNPRPKLKTNQPTPEHNPANKKEKKALTILWNHRWEWDKAPELLLEIIKQSHTKDLPLAFALTGQQFRQAPPAFEEIQQKYAPKLLNFGFVASRPDYEKLIQQCDIVLSTAIHEFQGISVLEAVNLGCVPLLPKRLSYPEMFDDCYLYKGEGAIKQQATAAIKRLQHWLRDGLPSPPDVSHFEQQALSERYQQTICHQGLSSGSQ